MRINDAESLSDWVVELQDGVLAIQRTFGFASDLLLGEFVVRVGEFMPSSDVKVSVNPSPQGLRVEVVMRCLPESRLLQEAGKLAASCEYEFGSLGSDLAQSAA